MGIINCCKIKNEEAHQEISSERVDKKLKDANSLMNDLEPLSSEKKNNEILINGREKEIKYFKKTNKRNKRRK